MGPEIIWWIRIVLAGGIHGDRMNSFINTIEPESIGSLTAAISFK